MSIFSSYKKIFLLGFIIVILVAIPFSVYIAQKRQRTITKAAASTVLSFEPGSTIVKVGEILVLNIMLDPGTGTSANQVSFVKLSINFDSSKFAILSGNPSLSLRPAESPNTLTTIIDDPKYESGKASISLSIGADPTRVIITKTKIAIFQLKATDTTSPTVPNITFDTANTQVLSIASSDQTSENVLSTTNPATVTITSSTATTPTSTPTPTATSTSTGTLTSPAPQTGGGLSSSSLAPVCSNLEINGLISGTAPYPLTFTATGSDSDGIINKISFNFGDSIEDLTVGGGIGTSSVSAQISHTYNTPGIYTAYAILTDNNNNLSAQQASCTKTITINSTDLSGSPQSNQPLPPTGDGKIMFGLGALGIIFTIIGGVLLLL